MEKSRDDEINNLPKKKNITRRNKKEELVRNVVIVDDEDELNNSPKEKIIIGENPKSPKNKTKKNESACKKITNIEICNSLEGCIVNKSNKCQKKPEKEKDFKINQEESVDKNNLFEKPIDEIINTKNGHYDISNSACDELKIIKDNLNKTRKNYDEKNKECEEEMFGEFVRIYFNKPDNKLTHKDLLIGLQRFYIDEKEKDINFILSMQDFIQRFSQKTNVLGTNYKRQHIFEALCRLLVFFNYDNGELGINKNFYTSLEKFIKGKKDKINDVILPMKINEGSASGIVDIFFKSKKNNKNDNLWACESVLINEQPQDITNQNEYIMIQNKYYDKEKSNISNYDVTRIYALASLTNEKHSNFDGPMKIVLMVNNEDAVSHNLEKAKQQYPELIYKIYGVVSLNTWFQQMLYDLYKSKTINNFLDKSTFKETDKPILQLRFHQKYIITCTNKCID